MIYLKLRVWRSFIVIELVNVSKRVNSKNGIYSILENVNLKLPECGIVAVKSTDNAVNSTLLNLISTFYKPNTGSIMFDNVDLVKLSYEELLKFREEYISFIFKEEFLFENLTVLENITLVGQSNDLDSFIKDFELQDILNVKVRNLSKEDRLKVSICRALLKKSKIILVDEVINSLTIKFRDLVYDILKRLSSESLVIVSLSEENSSINPDMVIEIQDNQVSDVRVINNCNGVSNNFKYKNSFNEFKFTFKNFFTNKFRVMFNVFVLVLTFVFVYFFVYLSSVDFNTVHSNYMNKNNDNLIVIESNHENIEYQPNEIDYKDVENIESTNVFSSHVLLGKQVNVNGKSIGFEFNNFNSNVPYYEVNLNNFSFFNVKDLKYEVIGRKPKLDNEIVISSYIAQRMMKFGVMNNENEYYFPKDYQDLVSSGEKLLLGNKEVIVVGVYVLDLDSFSILKEKEEIETEKLYNLENLLSGKLNNEATNIYVLEDFFNLYMDDIPVVRTDIKFKTKINSKVIINNLPVIFNEPVLLQDGTTISDLSNNEIIVNEQILSYLKLSKNVCINETINLYVDGSNEKMEFIIKGVSRDGKYYINLDMLRKFLDKKVYYNKILYYVDNMKEAKNIFETFPLKSDVYTVRTNYSHIVMGLRGIFDFINKILLVFSIILLYFSICLMHHYLKKGLNNHKKDLIILETLGVEDKKIENIFKIELFLQCIVAFVISFVFSSILTVIINNSICDISNLSMNVISFNILYFLVMFILFIAVMLVLIKTMKRNKDGSVISDFYINFD